MTISRLRRALAVSLRNSCADQSVGELRSTFAGPEAGRALGYRFLVPIERMAWAGKFTIEQPAEPGFVDPARIGELGPVVGKIEELELASERDGILQA